MKRGKQENKGVKVLAVMQAEVSSDSFTVIQDYCVYLVCECVCVSVPGSVEWRAGAGGGAGSVPYGL